MHAHTTVTPEFSYSPTYGNRFLCITFRGSYPLLSLANIVRKSIPLGGVYIKVFPSVNKVNLYTLHGTYCEIDIKLDDLKIAFEMKRPFLVKFLNNYNQLIEAYIPHSYVSWMVNEDINCEISNDHYFGNFEQPFVIDLTNDNKVAKHIENSFIYVENSHKHNNNLDFLYYG